MDPLKLLSRSTKISRLGRRAEAKSIPSTGQNAPPQLFPEQDDSQCRKRKRDLDKPAFVEYPEQSIDFFGASNAGRRPENERNAHTAHALRTPIADASAQSNGNTDDVQIPLEERKRIFKEHKVKVTWLNQQLSHNEEKRKRKGQDIGKYKKTPLFPRPVRSLTELESRYEVASRLAANVVGQGYAVPTEVQLAALPLLLNHTSELMTDDDGVLSGLESMTTKGIDLMAIAPTGSGKTLAYLIPLLQSILNKRPKATTKARHTSAIILVPTKELAGQIVNEGRKLCEGTGLKITKLRKGMRLAEASADGEHDSINVDDSENSATKADVVVSTPGLLHGVIDTAKSTALSDVQHFVLDEGDVLLDPLFREQTLQIWDGLSNPDLRISMWSATVGSNIEELVASTINARRKRIATENDIEMDQTPLLRLVVGLKDSAIPNVQHKLTYAATEQGKLMGLRQILHPTSSSADSGSPLIPPFLVFTQTIERAIALHSELLYDIPAEAGGISRIAVLHADLSDTARDSVMTKFREGEIWVLITTDLLSRGVDFRGVNGVVNYDIPTSSAAYVHRVGRTGRAGREGGVAVTLYSKEDIPYLKHVVNVISAAQKEKDGQEATQQWLMEALPRLSNNEKQRFRKHGVESRTTTGKRKDPKAASKARISTKAGFVRRNEKNRKGAILGNQKGTQDGVPSDDVGETEFGGFD